MLRDRARVLPAVPPPPGKESDREEVRAADPGSVVEEPSGMLGRGDCLRCERVVAALGVPPEQTLCGRVTHELARRLDRERVGEVSRRVAELSDTFDMRGLGSSWAISAQIAGEALLALAARRREADEEAAGRCGE